MQKYTDLVLGQNSQTLVPIPGASVSVLAYPSGTSATIYSDNGITQTANPLTTDNNGRFSFYAANGRYSLQVTYQTVSYTIADILLDDPANGQPVIVTGGSIDNTPIGATTPSSGAFTTLSTTGNFTSSHVIITGGSIDNTPIGTTTPSSGAFTILSASSTVSGAGFSSYFASPPPIGGTVPASGAFTTLSTTGNFTPSQTNGIVGTTTNNNANAGSIGEYVQSTFSGVSLVNVTTANATSISLTAGDWDVEGGIDFSASTTNMTNIAAGSSSTSVTFPAAGYYWQVQQTAGFQNYGAAIPRQRFSISSTTTIYMPVQASFTTGTVTVAGVLRARRVR